MDLMKSKANRGKSRRQRKEQFAWPCVCVVFNGPSRLALAWEPKHPAVVKASRHGTGACALNTECKYRGTRCEMV